MADRCSVIATMPVGLDGMTCPRLAIAPRVKQRVAEQRAANCRGRPEGWPFPESATNVMIVVDDGLAAHSSMRAARGFSAASWSSNRMRSARLRRAIGVLYRLQTERSSH
jgi:hypothetical protein